MMKGELLCSYPGKDFTLQEKKKFDEYYESFKEAIEFHLKRINPENLWESPEIPDIRDRQKMLEGRHPYEVSNEDDLKFKIHGYDDFNDKFVKINISDEEAFFNGWDIEVYDYGKGQGLQIETTEEILRTSLVMVACKRGFHRDWAHDAICVKNSRPEYSDVQRSEYQDELRHARAERQNVEDAENRGGWPYEL